MKLTKEEEERAIKALKKVAKIWPESLWLFSANGELFVMRKNEKKERVIKPNELYKGGKADWFSGFDQDYIVADIDIENEGGDW